MKTHEEIVIIGGGLIASAIALELKQRGANVTLLCRDSHQAATLAAAGMLAPQAEQISPGPMAELCQRSLALYPDWASKLESLTGKATGYWPCGILAPVYESSPTPPSSQAIGVKTWLDRATLQHYQPGLGPEVAGAWWYPEEGQVDNRALFHSLRAALIEQGVTLKEGVTVESWVQQNRRITSLRTSLGDWQADHYILATGAWASELLPLPVRPRKGQMLALQVPPALMAQGLPLQRVLFGEESYIVPRRDGRIVIGATSEDVGFTPHNTAQGVQNLLQRAIRLFPALAELPIQELWWGFRPTTPDESPILGESPCENLTLATGHHRNGILLAPITAQLIADRLINGQTDPLLAHFHYDRFSRPAPTQYPSPLEPAMLTSVPPAPVSPVNHDPLIIGGRSFTSRLMTGTGKYRSISEMQESVISSGCEIVTVAVRRVQTNAPGHEGLAEALDWSKIWMLPNTAGCQTAEEAIRVARLGREMAKLLGQEDNNFIKLEVIPDAKYLLPDPIGTLQAAEQLVKEGFAVLPYINADPLLAKRLEEVGCATVMPLGSPIGSGQGIKNAANIQIIIENAQIPVVVDAGLATPSEASQAMEMGASAVLINTAIAQAQNPAQMALAMKLGVEAGRLAYHAGRIPPKAYASASSPLTGLVQ